MNYVHVGFFFKQSLLSVLYTTYFQDLTLSFSIYFQTKSFADTDCMGRGKQSIAIDLKQKEGLNIVHKMCSKADVLIEPFRPGEIRITMNLFIFMDTNFFFD